MHRIAVNLEMPPTWEPFLHALELIPHNDERRAMGLPDNVAFILRLERWMQAIIAWVPAGAFAPHRQGRDQITIEAMDHRLATISWVELVGPNRYVTSEQWPPAGTIITDPSAPITLPPWPLWFCSELAVDFAGAPVGGCDVTLAN